MKKLILILLLVFILVSCDNDDIVNDNFDNEQALVEEYIYESPYVIDYNFRINLLNELYYSYNDVFAGIYLVDGYYNVNITEEAPQTLINKLEQNGIVTHHIVNFSYAELWTVKEIVLIKMIEVGEFQGLGISQQNNTVLLTLKTDTVVPESFSHYIETGILTIEFSDLEWTH